MPIKIGYLYVPGKKTHCFSLLEHLPYFCDQMCGFSILNNFYINCLELVQTSLGYACASTRLPSIQTPATGSVHPCSAHHSLFTHLSVRRLSCLHLWAVANSDSVDLFTPSSQSILSSAMSTLLMGPSKTCFIYSVCSL